MANISAVTTNYIATELNGTISLNRIVKNNKTVTFMLEFTTAVTRAVNIAQLPFTLPLNMEGLIILKDGVLFSNGYTSQDGKIHSYTNLISGNTYTVSGTIIVN